MATVYVSSVDGSDADSGADWTNAKATVTGGLAICTDPTNIIYVDSAHSNIVAGSITWNLPNDGQVSIISVNRGTMARLTGAFTNVTGNNAITIGSAAFRQMFFLDGMVITGSTGTGSGNSIIFASSVSTEIGVECVNCVFSSPLTNTSGNAAGYVLGPTAAAASTRNEIKFKNCSFALMNHGSGKGFSFRLASPTFHNCTFSYAGGAKPNVLFWSGTGSSAARMTLRIVNCDLSGYEASGGSYFDVGNWTEANVMVRNCKISSTPSLVTGTYATNLINFTFINVDSGDTKNVFEYRTRLGTITENTSVYANSGGKFDASGISWQIITSALCDEYNAFISPWLMRWVESTSSIDVGLRVVHDSATDLHNRNSWQEIEYISDASFPLGTLVSGRNAQAFDGSAVDWTNDSETWTGTGGFGTANTQTLQSTFTPSEKSLIRGRLAVGVASKTLYLDPALRVSGALSSPSVRWTNEGSFNAEPSAGGPIFGGMILQ